MHDAGVVSKEADEVLYHITGIIKPHCSTTKLHRVRRKKLHRLCVQVTLDLTLKLNSSFKIKILHILNRTLLILQAKFIYYRLASGGHFLFNTLGRHHSIGWNNQCGNSPPEKESHHVWLLALLRFDDQNVSQIQSGTFCEIHVLLSEMCTCGGSQKQNSAWNESTDSDVQFKDCLCFSSEFCWVTPVLTRLPFETWAVAKHSRESVSSQTDVDTHSCDCWSPVPLF